VAAEHKAAVKCAHVITDSYVCGTVLISLSAHQFCQC